MRVLMLSWEYPPVLVGGLGRHVHALAEAMARSGHRVTVLTRHAAQDGAGADRVPYDQVAGGVRVVRVPEDPVLLRFEDELLAWTMALNHGLTRAGLALAEAEPPDVVHAHDWLVAHAATTLKHHLRAPLVATLHATEAGRHQGWLPEPLNRAIHSVEWWLTYEARRVLTCSSSMRWEVTRLFELPAEKVDVVPNGVDPDRWRASPEQVAAARRRWAGDGPLVVCSGRLVYEKGVHDLLAALPRLRRRHPGVRLVVAGRGPKEVELRELARRLRLGRSVAFAGFVPDADLAALVAAADCAVVPSVYEPFGMVALEATAAGTPVAVSDVGGLREIVEHRGTGLRFPAGDPAGLTDAVSELLTDQVLARRLVRQARAVLQQDHSWARIAERTGEVYQRAGREERVLRAGLASRRVPRLVMRDGNLLAGSP
ncbi:MAG TPA: glycosyltransferase family 4 protein [Mycobacteriales bacterium]|nr:glycosyltransferase family 4 protein [Mycobacteriales bacterium]